MGIITFLLLIVICMALIYFVHRYFGKEEFYLLAIIYAILSFLMSFKLVNLFGLDINAGIIFSSGLLAIWYYFTGRYSISERKKLMIIIFISTLVMEIIMLINSFMMPSIYDKTSILYQRLMLENIAIAVFYPLSLCVTLFLSGYCFDELKKEKNKKFFKLLITMLGIIFIDMFIFSYFSYAILVRFDISLTISVSNYLIKLVIVFLYLFIINRLFNVRKVK